jgi:hypothetical protein
MTASARANATLAELRVIAGLPEPSQAARLYVLRNAVRDDEVLLPAVDRAINQLNHEAARARGVRLARCFCEDCGIGMETIRPLCNGCIARRQREESQAFYLAATEAATVQTRDELAELAGLGLHPSERIYRMMQMLGRLDLCVANAGARLVLTSAIEESRKEVLARLGIIVEDSAPEAVARRASEARAEAAKECGRANAEAYRKYRVARWGTDAVIFLGENDLRSDAHPVEDDDRADDGDDWRPTFLRPSAFLAKTDNLVDDSAEWGDPRYTAYAALAPMRRAAHLCDEYEPDDPMVCIPSDDPDDRRRKVTSADLRRWHREPLYYWNSAL